MARKPLTSGGRYVEHRAGLGGFVWEGMATKIDPGGSPPTRPRFLENVRIQGGSIISRPDFAGAGALVPAITVHDPTISVTTVENGVGQLSKKNRLGFRIGTGQAGTEFSLWDPSWAAEFNSVGGTRLWWGSTPPLAYDPLAGWQVVSTGAMFGFIDTDADPVLNRVGTYQSGDSWPPCIEKFNTEVYVGDFGCLRKVMLLDPPAGYSPAMVLSEPSDFIVLDYPGYRTTAMVEHQGMLWILLTDPSNTVNAEMWSYDGLVAVQEKVFTVSGSTGAAVAVYKNQLVVAINGEGEIHVKAPDGTWTDGITVGGFDSSPYLNSMAQYRDKLMIMDGVDKIYSYDGTNLALEHTIGLVPVNDPVTGQPPVPALAYCCMVMNDIFYYGWTNIDFPVPILATGGQMTYAQQPTAGQYVRIPLDYGSTAPYIQYTFKTSVAVEGDVKIGATIDDTFTNLVNCINRTHPFGTPGQNIVGGNYYALDPHDLISGAINVGLDLITLTVLTAGWVGNISMATNVPLLTITNPSGGVGPIGQSVCLGKHDGDDPSWDDYFVKPYAIFRYAEGSYDWPAADGGITAMAFYRGRIWVAVSGVPSGNSFVMTHSIQYAPYDGWQILDSVGSGNADQTNKHGTAYHGPGHNVPADDLNGGATEPQIYYLRSI